MHITRVGPGPHVCWVILPKASVRIRAVSECIMRQGNHEVVQAVHIAYQMAHTYLTYLMKLNCVLHVVYENTDAPGFGTWLFTTFAYGKSGKYGHICRGDGRQVRQAAKMISSLSSVGCPEVSTPALRRAHHKELECKHKQELASLGVCTYVAVDDEGNDEPAFAMLAPCKGSKLKHDHKVGQVAGTLDQRIVDDLYAPVSLAARAVVQQGCKNQATVPRDRDCTSLARRRTLSTNWFTICSAAWTFCNKQRIRQTQTQRAFGRMWWISRRKTHGCDRNVTMQCRCKSGLADATRLWQLVDHLGGNSPMRGRQGMGLDSPRETQNVISSPTSKGRRRN